MAAGNTASAQDPVDIAKASHTFVNEPRQTAAQEGADALIIVTEWRAFRSTNFDTLKTRLKHTLIFDGRNFYDPKLVRVLGFGYLAIGR